MQVTNLVAMLEGFRALHRGRQPARAATAGLANSAKLTKLATDAAKGIRAVLHRRGLSGISIYGTDGGMGDFCNVFILPMKHFEIPFPANARAI